MRTLISAPSFARLLAIFFALIVAELPAQVSFNRLPSSIAIHLLDGSTSCLGKLRADEAATFTAVTD